MEFQPKNSTTARKAGNDMKKNASLPKMGDNPASWQKADKGLGFNGQDNGSSQRAQTNRYAHNPQNSIKNPDAIQETQMPVRKGYHGAKTAGPVTAAGAGVTGRRDWAPSAGQNFKGNADRIQDRQMPNRKGNMC